MSIEERAGLPGGRPWNAMRACPPRVLQQGFTRDCASCHGISVATPTLACEKKPCALDAPKGCPAARSSIRAPARNSSHFKKKKHRRGLLHYFILVQVRLVQVSTVVQSMPIVNQSLVWSLFQNLIERTPQEAGRDCSVGAQAWAWEMRASVGKFTDPHTVKCRRHN